MKKVLMVIGGIVFLVGSAALYMYLMRLEPRDFYRMPVGVLDDAIYAAQQNDKKAFRRTFTAEMQEYMDKMHDSNINREMGTTSESESADLFWTWETLMASMSKEGGFVVKPTSTKFLDYMVDGKAKIEIVYYDKAQKRERQKNYTLFRTGGVWRIDLKSNPDFIKAYRQSVRELRSITSLDEVTE